MNNPIIGLIVIINYALAGQAIAAEEWQASALSRETINKVQSETVEYHRCLGGEISQMRNTQLDSRDATSLILKKCENKLIPIKETFLSENVEVATVNRFLMRKRHQAVRKVLQAMMFAQSQRTP